MPPAKPFTPAKHTNYYPLLLALVALLGATSLFLYFAGTGSSAAKAQTITLPPDAVKISGCIPHEGEHWVRVPDLPNGPFYVTYNNQVTAFEYMVFEDKIPGKEFAHMPASQAMEYMQKNNLSLSDLVKNLSEGFPLPPVSFKKMTLHWTPPHAGLTVPHYDMHFYLWDNAQLDQICPDAAIESTLPQDLVKDLMNRGIDVPAFK